MHWRSADGKKYCGVFKSLLFTHPFDLSLYCALHFVYLLLLFFLNIVNLVILVLLLIKVCWLFDYICKGNSVLVGHNVNSTHRSCWIKISLAIRLRVL